MQHMSMQEEELLFTDLDDLERLSSNSSQQDVENAIHKYTTQLEHVIKMLLNRNDKRQEPKVSSVQYLSVLAFFRNFSIINILILSANRFQKENVLLLFSIVRVAYP